MPINSEIDMFPGMNGGNMAGMMKKVQKMQQEMAKMQQELKESTVEVASGGGMVKVVVNGDKKIVSLNISPEVVQPDDIEMLQDLISAAVNEAMTKVDEKIASEMGKFTGGLNLPPGLF